LLNCLCGCWSVRPPTPDTGGEDSLAFIRCVMRLPNDDDGGRATTQGNFRLNCRLQYSTLRYIVIGEPRRGEVHMTVEGIRGSSDRSVLVLTSLAGGPKHGYGLIKDIEGFAGVKLRSGDAVRMPRQAGTGGTRRSSARRGRRHPYRINRIRSASCEGATRRVARIAELGLGRVAGAMS